MKLNINNEDILIHDLAQDTDEWLDWRNAGIGSSDIILLFEPKGSFDRNLFGLWKDRCGFEKFNFTANIHTLRGKDLESGIRDRVNSILGMEFKPLCISRASAPYLRASLDGMDLRSDALLEIKSPSDTVFLKYLKEKSIPDNYYMQIQYQMLVSGAEYAYYSFYNVMHPDPYIIPVENNLELQVEIQRRCEIFWGAVESKTPIGFDENGNLKLHPVRPVMFINITNDRKNLSGLKSVSEPVMMNESFVYQTSDLTTIKKVRELNPDHEVIFESNMDNPFRL